ncbi:transposase [Escherichia coli]|nr:transposase [Escherichia coli]
MIDVLGPEKRRRRTTQEKIAIVQQSFEPGMTVSLVARQHGVAASQLFLWRKQYQEGSLTAVAAGEQVVPASELAAAMKQIKELQRLLGKKTMENELLKEAVEYGRAKKLDSARALIARGWGVSLVSRCLRVSRAQLHVILRRTDDWMDGRRSRHTDDTDVLLRIHHVIGELPTYGYRRVPLYVSLYPTEGGMQDIIDCIRAELGVRTTKNAVFQHIQSLPRGQQKEALLASAALPLLFRPREVQGTMFGDGGMGGWRNMQGNTPVTPLVDAGCNMVIVTHLSDGSLWDRQAFPDTTILEIRPRKRLKYAGDGGNSGGLLSFTSAHTDAWRQQGYEDTMLAMEHIRKPLAARQALTRSEAVLQKSLDITEEADLALRNAMARIK